MYYTICPLCQTVCKKRYDDEGFQLSPNSDWGICKHPEENFFYSFTKNNFGGVTVDLSLEKFSVVLDTYRKTTLITNLYTDDKHKLYFLFPIDWNYFKLENFEDKIKQIVNLKIFY
jgi:hypothetical protein